MKTKEKEPTTLLHKRIERTKQPTNHRSTNSHGNLRDEKNSDKPENENVGSAEAAAAATTIFLAVDNELPPPPRRRPPEKESEGVVSGSVVWGGREKERKSNAKIGVEIWTVRWEHASDENGQQIRIVESADASLAGFATPPRPRFTAIQDGDGPNFVCFLVSSGPIEPCS